MNSFETFGLPQELNTALTRMLFKEPTPIQSKTIPTALTGKDIVGQAQTGTGKTAAFLIPALSRLIANPELKVLVLAPTRELAIQIDQVFLSLTEDCQWMKSAVLIGGASIGKQRNRLQKGVHFVIATPGRLNDLLRNRWIDLSNYKILVLDEVDRMLDMGFLPQVEDVLAAMPSDRQNLLFSATLPKNAQKLIQRIAKDPVFLSVGETQKAVDRVTQTHIEVAGPLKNETLVTELKKRTGTTLIFARTKIRTDRLSRFLKDNGIKASAIHGGRTQRQREEALDRFQSGHSSVLVATDVASRGLDVPGINLVVNFDLPETREDYLHRIGRTARGSAHGEALSFVTPEEKRHWAQLSSDKERQGGDDYHHHRSRRPSGRRNNGGGGNSRFGRKFKSSNSEQGGSERRFSKHRKPKNRFFRQQKAG